MAEVVRRKCTGRKGGGPQRRTMIGAGLLRRKKGESEKEPGERPKAFIMLRCHLRIAGEGKENELISKEKKGNIKPERVKAYLRQES